MEDFTPIELNDGGENIEDILVGTADSRDDYSGIGCSGIGGAACYNGCKDGCSNGAKTGGCPASCMQGCAEGCKEACKTGNK